MDFRWKGKVVYSYSKRRLLYTLCFFLFCVIDQRIKTGSGLDGVIETFRDLTGVGMAVLTMSHYRKEDFKKYKLPYIIWSVLSVIGGMAAFFWGRDMRPFLNDWIVVIIDVVLYGYILIHTFINVVLEKKYPKLNVKFAVVWVVMMVLMIVSRSTYIWPFCYLVMFACFYLTDYSKEEQVDMFQGMLDGIILGFFVLQGLCFVFRPYDVVRYQGMYHNPNLNALFYLEVLAAVFGKILYVTKQNANKWIKVYYWLGAGVVLSFVFMSIGRTAWIVAFLLGLVFLWALKKITMKKNFVKNGIVLVLCACLTFPLCFGAARYLPPVFHHPIWFWGEWSDERVHSWDEWDSEKYVDIDEFLEAALGRIAEGVESLLEHLPGAVKVEAAEEHSQNMLNGEQDTEDAVTEATGQTVIEDTEELPENMIPALERKDISDTFLTRSTIYKYYFKNLNFWGHPYEEQGFMLAIEYWIGHAHNIFLQYGTDFGVPVMILFIVLVLWAVAIMLKKFKGQQSIAFVCDLMYLMIPILFGMLEYSWGVGSLSITMMFIAWRKAICNE